MTVARVCVNTYSEPFLSTFPRDVAVARRCEPGASGCRRVPSLNGGCAADTRRPAETFARERAADGGAFPLAPLRLLFITEPVRALP